VNFRLTTRPARMPADLQADSATVRYDLDMLFEAAERYVRAEQHRDVVGKNVAVESFAIHCRAIIYFLFGHLDCIERPGGIKDNFSPPRPTDVLAHDYHPGWWRDCPAPTQKRGTRSGGPTSTSPT
jgi:hypothetical protein